MKIKSYLIVTTKTLFVFLFLLLNFCSLSTQAQITSANASHKSLTQYSAGAQDSVYVFCDQLGTGAGELKASSSDGLSDWTFTWTKWDSNTSDFTIPVLTENNQSESYLSNLTNGLYRVDIDNGSQSYQYQAWVINNSNSNPVLNLSLLDCVGVHFTSSFTKKNLQYLDIPGSGLLNITVDDKLIFSLSRNGIEVQRTPVENYDDMDKSFIDQDAFEDEESYAMTVIDQYGCEFTSDVVTTSTYVVKAEFTVNPEKGEAPLEVSFTNTSLNATDFEWYLYQDYDRIIDATSIEDSLVNESILTDKNIEPYTYIHPGNYLVKLMVSSDKGPEVCNDEFILNTPIVVDTSLVQVPNVFTPNGDGRNDIWRIKSQSLKSFHAIVFNRWGRVVYEWKNPDEGWNGKINGKWASPGTYFYVITAVGREEQTKKYSKKGSFMLIRK